MIWLEPSCKQLNISFRSGKPILKILAFISIWVVLFNSTQCWFTALTNDYLMIHSSREGQMCLHLGLFCDRKAVAVGVKINDFRVLCIC